MWSRLLSFSKPVNSQLRSLNRPICSNVYSYRYFSTATVTPASVESAVIEILKNTEGVFKSKISPRASFVEVGLDSLAVNEMFSTLEEDFKITLSDDDTDGLKGIPDLVKLILSKIK